MRFDKTEDDSTIASEIFSPDLSDAYKERYHHLIIRLTHALPINRVNIIRNEISQMHGFGERDFEKLKYITALSVLVDLTQQGWILNVVLVRKCVGKVISLTPLLSLYPYYCGNSLCWSLPIRFPSIA